MDGRNRSSLFTGAFSDVEATPGNELGDISFHFSTVRSTIKSRWIFARSSVPMVQLG